MTPQEHNKFLGFAHLGYAGLHLLMMVVMMLFMGAMFTSMFRRSEGAPPAFFFVIMFGFMGFFYVLMTIPSIVAGYALLKRRSWAKIAAIIGGVVAAMSFPIGTAVCVYTFWFLFSEPGKVLYDKPTQGLPPPPPSDWAIDDRQEERERQYVPPAAAPDWR